MTRNPAAEATGPGVDEVVAPACAACDEGAEAEVPVSWSAPSATSVRLLVDGEALPGEQPPVGEATVALPCDGVVHVVVVAALDDGPQPSLGSVAVLTEPRG